MVKDGFKQIPCLANPTLPLGGRASVLAGPMSAMTWPRPGEMMLDKHWIIHVPCSSVTCEKPPSGPWCARGTGMAGPVTLGCNVTGRLREAACSLELLILAWNLLMTCRGLLSSLPLGAGIDPWGVFSNKMHPSEMDFSF